MAWQGVILTESLEEFSIFSELNIIKATKSFLKGIGTITFNKFELDNAKKEYFLYKVSNAIKSGFYCHIVQGNSIYVIFKGITFNLSNENKFNLELAKAHARGEGILESQINFETFIANALK